MANHGEWSNSSIHHPDWHVDTHGDWSSSTSLGCGRPFLTLLLDETWLNGLEAWHSAGSQQTESPGHAFELKNLLGFHYAQLVNFPDLTGHGHTFHFNGTPVQA